MSGKVVYQALPVPQRIVGGWCEAEEYMDLRKHTFQVSKDTPTTLPLKFWGLWSVGYPWSGPFVIRMQVTGTLRNQQVTTKLWYDVSQAGKYGVNFCRWATLRWVYLPSTKRFPCGDYLGSLDPSTWYLPYFWGRICSQHITMNSAKLVATQKAFPATRRWIMQRILWHSGRRRSKKRERVVRRYWRGMYQGPHMGGLH